MGQQRRAGFRIWGLMCGVQDKGCRICRHVRSFNGCIFLIVKIENESRIQSKGAGARGAVFLHLSCRNEESVAGLAGVGAAAGDTQLRPRIPRARLACQTSVLVSGL